MLRERGQRLAPVSAYATGCGYPFCPSESSKCRTMTRLCSAFFGSLGILVFHTDMYLHGLASWRISARPRLSLSLSAGGGVMAARWRDHWRRDKGRQRCPYPRVRGPAREKMKGGGAARKDGEGGPDSTINRGLRCNDLP